MLQFFEQFAELLQESLAYLELDEGYDPESIRSVEIQFVRPPSVFLTVGYDVPYNCCYMVHLRSVYRRLCLAICPPGCFKLSDQREQTLPIEHKNASYMVRRIFSLRSH